MSHYRENHKPANSMTVVQALVIFQGMKLYLATGMKANSAYTPKAMMATAGAILGKAYKRNELATAARDLEAWINEQKAARAA